MSPRSLRPALRHVETIVVPSPRYGRVLVLRDPHGITGNEAAIPLPLVPIVERFTGEMTCEEIASDAGRELGCEVPVDVVVRLASELERGLFLAGATFDRARADVAKAFADAPVRPASHAGGAYHADPDKLGEYLDGNCLGAAKRKKNGHARMVGLIAPHIDPWRGAVGYGHAYNAMAESLPEGADTFVLLGTSHAPMREHFALCRKAFDTPMGHVDADLASIDAIAAKSPFDAYADQFNHKREHSLEFQVVFLKHLYKERPIRIIPILASLGSHQVRATDPAKDDHANAFLDAVGEVVSSLGARVAVVAGADFAHVGPRFGDPAPLREAERKALEQSDRQSIELASARDARGFWSDVAKDLATRRVCGLAPIYAMLRVLPERARGELLHYEQTIDDDDGSIVSHAAVGFYG